MFKRIFSFFLFLILSIISFYSTRIIIDYLKELDPIMIQIKKNCLNNQKDAVDASINDMYIIPGISGYEVDFNKSYQKMKKYGSYNSKLLVYKKKLPNLSITNIYDKYVSYGNPSINNVTMVFKIDDYSFLDKIIPILIEEKVQATFFINSNLLVNNINLIKYLDSNDQDIQFILNNNTSIDYLIYLINNHTSKHQLYCYSDNVNSNLLKLCQNKKIHVIIPSLNTNKFPYYELKDKIENGSIIKLNNNYQTSLELKYIINYIRQNNYNIVSLEKLLEE